MYIYSTSLVYIYICICIYIYIHTYKWYLSLSCVQPSWFRSRLGSHKRLGFRNRLGFAQPTSSQLAKAPPQRCSAAHRGVRNRQVISVKRHATVSLVCFVLYIDVLSVSMRFSVRFCIYIYEHIQNYAWREYKTTFLSLSCSNGLGTYLIV